MYFTELEKLGKEDVAATKDLWSQHNNKVARLVETLKNGQT